MKIRREFKIGIFAVIVILVSWWGIKWLGGQNLLLTSSNYYAYYEDVSGLMVSSRVKLRGVVIGNVQEINLEGDKVKVEMLIENKYAEMIPSNSVAELGAAGLMGGTEINIIQGDGTEAIAPKSTIEGRIKPDMIGDMAGKASGLIDGLTTTVDSINTLLGENGEPITQMIANLEAMTATINTMVAAAQHNLNGTLGNLRTFTDSLADNTSHIESMLSNLDRFSTDLAEAQFIEQLSTTINQLNSAITAINEGNGTAGMLLNDKALYDSLNQAGNNLALLLEDLKTNPKRYVHFSLFGSSQSKEERKAEREARKAAKNE